MSNNEDVEKLEPSHTGQVFIVLKSRVEIEQEYEKCSFGALKKFTSPRGDVKLHHYSENSLSVPQKVKHRVTTSPSISTPLDTPQRNENQGAHTNVYTSIYSTILHNS